MMKKLLICIMALMLSCASLFSGCAGKGLADYEDCKGHVGITLSGTGMPKVTEEAFRDMKAVGFDTMNVNEYQYGVVGSDIIDTILNLTAKVGLNARLTLSSTKNQENISTGKYFGDIDRILNKDYRNFYALTSIRLWDEPDISQFEKIGGWIEQTNVSYPGMPIIVNLLPVYASYTALGGTYDEYVSQYFEKIISKMTARKIVTCDYYPFESKNQSTMKTGLLQNLEYLALACKENDADLGWFIQTGSYEGHRVPLGADINFQLFACMAFGVKDISCYTYQTPLGAYDHPAGSYAFLDVAGNKTEVYEQGKEVIQNLRTFDYIYANFDWQSIMTVFGESNVEEDNESFSKLSSAVEKVEGVSKVEATEDTVVSYLYDEERDQKGYVILNYEDPYWATDDIVKITFKGCSQAMVCKDGEKQIVSLKKGCLEIKLGKGEGAFVLPY